MPKITARVTKKAAALSLPSLFSSQVSNLEGSSASSSGKNWAEYIRAVTPLYMESQKLNTPRMRGQPTMGQRSFRGVELLHLDLQLPVGPAHHHRLFFGAAHHDPLDEGLAAAHGLEALGAGRAPAAGGPLCLFVFHKNEFSLCFAVPIVAEGRGKWQAVPTARWAGGW